MPVRMVRVGVAAFALTLAGCIPFEMLSVGSTNAAPTVAGLPDIHLQSVACWTATNCVGVGATSEVP
jgi:hypothetical protein